MSSDHKNLILALALSMGVLIVWNILFPPPQVTDELNAPKPIPTEQTGSSVEGIPVPQSDQSSSAALASGEVAGSFVTREAALKTSQRVIVTTPTLQGSINLEGARFDDLMLKKYRETIDVNSKNIVLFSPSKTEHSYFASFGWLGISQGTGSTPTDKTVWNADKQELTPGNPVTLSWDNGQGIVFERQISVDDKSMFTIHDRIKNNTDQDLSVAAYGLISRLVPLEQGTAYYILHEGAVGWIGDNGLQELTVAKLNDAKPLPQRRAKGEKWDDVKGGFISITDKYWASAIVPDQQASYQAVFSLAQTNGREVLQTDMRSPVIAIPANGSTEHIQRLFAGAKEVSVIDSYQKSLGILHFDRMVDWGYFYFFTKYLFMFLNFLNKMLGNFGLSILVVTVVLKVLFMPLANKSYASMAKMKAVQPEMLAIKERYKDNPQEQQKATMELYKSKKINPVAGCWPMFIQIPVFFALYKVLFVTIEMRHAPFFGWIQDLAAPDPTTLFNLFGLLPYDPMSLPVVGGIISNYARLGVWPLIMGVTMWAQMKMNPEPTDPVQKQIFGWMPIMFTFMLGNFAAGLVIYWAWNNFLSIVQQGIIMKRHGTKIELWNNVTSIFKRNKETPSA